MTGNDCGSRFRLGSICMVLAIMVEYNLECLQLECKVTFLNTDADDAMYALSRVL